MATKKRKKAVHKKSQIRKPKTAKKPLKKGKKILPAGRQVHSKKSAKKLELNQQALGELIERGAGRGYVTDTEVLHYFPNIEDDVKFLDVIYAALDKANMKVIETSQLIEVPKEEISEKELRDATAFDDNLSDSVQMYLKEIGKAPLLKAVDERELAKRII